MNLIQQRLDNAKQMLENSVTLGDRSRALAELEVWQERLHSLERLDSMIEAVSGKRLTYAGLTA